MSHASLLVAVHGTEQDIENLVAEQMAPFDENGKTFFQDGSRWDYYVIGGRWNGYLCPENILQVKSVDLEAIKARALKDREAGFREYENQKDIPAEMKERIYGIKPGTTLEEYLRSTTPFPSFYAFLHEKRWHERERLGWFGMSTQTECERSGKDVQKCIHRGPDGAQIVSWGNDKEWGIKFYNRFVQPLNPDTWLVTVDYHV